jgi:hypothetical protein
MQQTDMCVCIYGNVWPNSNYNDKCFRQSCKENQNTHFVFNNLFPKIVPFMR